MGNTNTASQLSNYSKRNVRVFVTEKAAEIDAFIASQSGADDESLRNFQSVLTGGKKFSFKKDIECVRVLASQTQEVPWEPQRFLSIFVEDEDDENICSKQMIHNMTPSDMRPSVVFWVTYVLCLSLGLLCLLSVSYWSSHWRGGFSWDGSLQQFNWHPVLMVSGLVVLYGNAAIVYRIPFTWKQRKHIWKLVHAGLMFLALLLSVLGLCAVFDFHTSFHIRDLYSLHSWVGVCTVVVFTFQYYRFTASDPSPKFRMATMQKVLLFFFPSVRTQHREMCLLHWKLNSLKPINHTDTSGIVNIMYMITYTGDLFAQLMREDPSTIKGAEALMLGEMLTLPQNFGNIFLGETFSSYISVHNDSNQVVKDILVKADLQTSSQRLNLSASNSAVAELKPECCIDDVIHHEVKEIGTHILVCAVSYTTQYGEKLYFRKFFKFQVLKPLDVKTKFYNAETDEVFLEAQIQNITTSPMFMEKVSLEPSMMYNVTELNTVGCGDEGESTFGKMSYLQPMDTRQYLYCLKPKPEYAEKAGVIKGVTVIGKLDIVWKTNLGERGRLQTSQLQRMAPGYGDIRLSLEMIPDTVNLEEPFDIICKITNCSERTMDLVLEMCNTRSIHWCGVSGRQLGKLSPAAFLSLPLTLLSSVQGLQSISGLRLTDTFLKRTYEYDDIAQVCVVCPITQATSARNIIYLFFFFFFLAF
ncbi:hypothetical protein L3Q82_012449 [Scortum barcoo]|uniref:Uncharacterized protein n=1 Tax=Scortum barcoo TaxID=214431 RepID=A0ACB8W5R4_9TELE|nr:hypothetical protein L3Q82_012449 [Scortum barcoo]